MKEEFLLTYEMACYWWRRPDLESKPASFERVAQVLREAGIEVYGIDSVGLLICEPRPVGIREALTSQFRMPKPGAYRGYPEEQPGQVLRILKNKGVPIAVLGSPIRRF